MRDIKFRAWDTRRQKMWSPEEMGKDQLTLSPDGRGFVNVNGMSTKFSQWMSHLIPEQFTGLKDKNGKEIYEGDILSYAGLEGYLIVKWETFGWRLEHIIPEIDRYIQRFSWPPIQLPSGNFEYIEIIGNIHQPELMEKKQ